VANVVEQLALRPTLPPVLVVGADVTPIVHVPAPLLVVGTQVSTFPLNEKLLHPTTLSAKSARASWEYVAVAATMAMAYPTANRGKKSFENLMSTPNARMGAKRYRSVVDQATCAPRCGRTTAPHPCFKVYSKTEACDEAEFPSPVPGATPAKTRAETQVPALEGLHMTNFVRGAEP
jgi:hypothetical protein